MLLDIYFHHQNSAPKSGVNRLWLIEYYTEAFKKKPVEPVAAAKPKGRAISQRKAAQVERQREDAITQRIAKMVAKAEQAVTALTADIGDTVAAQHMVRQLIDNALQSQNTIADFDKIALNYRKRIQQEDDDLLLFAMAL